MSELEIKTKLLELANAYNRGACLKDILATYRELCTAVGLAVDTPAPTEKEILVENYLSTQNGKVINELESITEKISLITKLLLLES